MKNKIERLLGVITILLAALTVMGGCVNDSLSHVHDFRQKWDETKHFKECSCGEITDMAEHTLEWVVDLEPTYTAPGYKHKECQACGWKDEENTVIDRLLHEETLTECIIHNNSTMYSRRHFDSQIQLIEFLDENRDKIDFSILCVDAKSDPAEKISIVQLGKESSYVFSYDDECGFPSAEYEPEKYKNPCITIAYDLYSEELGSCIDSNDGESPLISISFFMQFCEIGDQAIAPTFDFYKYGNGTMNYVIKAMSNGKCIGEILYYTDLDVSREWIVNYLTKNMTVIK